MIIKRASKFWIKCAGVVASAALFVGAAQAEPVLQVDIDGGTYDSTNEDVSTSNPEFTVLALCSPGGQFTATDCLETTTFKLAIALTPPTEDAGDYGSIVVNGEIFNITSDMVYGVPPIDQYSQLFDAGDLQHGVYNTYFLELVVVFGGDTCGPSQYNVQDTPGVCDRTGTNSFYDEFLIDAANLAGGFGLHFDLYDALLLTKQSAAINDTDAGIFAPFSHDGSYNCCTQVSEPGTLGLLGVGLLGLGFTRRRRSVIQFSLN